MSETMMPLFENALNTIGNSIYIGLLVYSFCYAFYKPTINDLITRTNNLEGKQEILYQAIGKLRNIIEIDKDFSNDHDDYFSLYTYVSDYVPPPPYSKVINILFRKFQ